MKLAYLAPAVLEQILIARISPAVSLKDMSTIADMPWTAQRDAVFGNTRSMSDWTSGRQSSYLRLVDNASL
jgi:hypothetical protein